MLGSGKRASAYGGLSRWAATVSLAALMAAVPALASAQDAAPEEEEIVVTGIRAGLQSSVNAKRANTSLVEVVSAEDIGKLPDVSIAESLARLPGLAGQRVNGRAQVISIRGLAPDFTTTLLNGRQQASSGDNRAVEFDQYPSELLSSVVVYKTPDAVISGFGLSGTADLRTVRPLEFGRRAVALNLRGEMIDSDQLNDDVRNYGGRFSVSYIDQFANDTLGVAIGYAHLDSPSQNRHYKAYGYESFGGVSPGSVSPDSADDALQLNGQEAFAYSRQQVRDAVIGIVEWAPAPQFHSTLDLYYSTFEQDETMRGAQWFSNAWADNATFTNVETSEWGGSQVGTSGTFNNAVPQLRNDYNTRKDELFAAGLNAEYDISENVAIIGDLSYSKNERDETYIETYSGYGVGVGGVTGGTPDVGRTFDSYDFSFGQDGYPNYDFGLNYADSSQVSLGDRAPWGGWGHDGLLKSPHVEESITSGDIAMRFDLGDDGLSQFDVGVNLTTREKSKFVDEFDLNLKNGRQQILVDDQYLVAPTSLDFVGMGGILAVNLPAALPVYYDQTVLLDSNHYDKTWDISEDVLTFYTKLSLDAGPWRGNFGLQGVHVEQESTGSIIQGSPVVPIIVTEGEEYTDWLPSVNLTYDLGDGHRLRFGAARVMARPRMDEMRANVTPGFSIQQGGPTPQPGDVINPWTGSGGNPHLEPWRADAFDVAYEWYIDRTSYFSVALFYKDLETYIFNQALPFDFTGVPIPADQQPQVDLLPDGVIISPIGTMVRPANGEGGSIKGVEVSGAFDFGAVAAPLEGLGVIASYSKSESDLNPVGCTEFIPTNCPTVLPEVRIPGLSGEVYGLTGYYERAGFQARMSYRYRSPFKGEVVQLFTNRGATEILEDEQVDAQVGYTFQDGSPMEGLGILLQVNNLTDSPYRTRLGVDGGGTTTSDGSYLPETYEEYGRQILFGVNYRF